MKKLIPAVKKEDHSQGNPNAPIELVEYGDYECPYCGRAYRIVKNIQQQLSTNIRFVFRNFPLSKLHPHALAAAIAAEAAGRQNKFWEMHDLIFENQSSLNNQNINEFAKRLGLDLRKFGEDIQMEELAEKVARDFESGIRSGVNKTPSFFVNGKRYEGGWEQTEFAEYLNGWLERSLIEQV